MFALQAVDVRTDERLLGRLFEMIQYLSKRSNDTITTGTQHYTMDIAFVPAIRAGKGGS